MDKITRRKVYICKFCDYPYPDAPVSQCDCLGATDQPPPHFIIGTITYRKPPPPKPMRDCHACGYRYKDALGPHGCPNCHGEGLE